MSLITQLQAIIEGARTGAVWQLEKGGWYPFRVCDAGIEFLHPNCGWRRAGRSMEQTLDMGALCRRVPAEEVKQLELKLPPEPSRRMPGEEIRERWARVAAESVGL